MIMVKKKMQIFLALPGGCFPNVLYITQNVIFGRLRQDSR